ncbi:ABC-ATPase domain-containing protein [Salipaludibacillus agaradhaerens]|uniref:ABC-ATPase domain-containing protein n=1 Tax=Salipaludibacillus agaradhaerens TaxID=76935 RepID=A0A9Q4B1R1_SALAG|nr:ABC-ATPase domain-containing protein [Salipaludibacillus agaradhaerens]MCR6096432.1 ABC-ATPase domain-containing protein [Salipaludibacillus agaradhaerens]MCR6114009.1 ABC-ATPase domain-containing protein [Salipaludibacillus agaradhaerens]
MEHLSKQLIKLDGKSYRALKSIQGAYDGDMVTLFIDYVQGDPFAAPSRVRVFIPHTHTDLNPSDYVKPDQMIALKHFFAKECHKQLQNVKNTISGTGKSGLIFIDVPGQEVIDRTAVFMTPKGIEFRLSCGLPAQGRRILGHQANTLLTSLLPKIIINTVKNYDRESLKKALILANDQKHIRLELKKRQLVSFIANNSILPRKTGVSHKPMLTQDAVPFESPAKDEIILKLPSGKQIRGMAIKKGVTLITGGGYHGKSTLLQAIEKGVYNHEIGDGREYVITDESAIKIRSEDGRMIKHVNISPFINDLPFGKTTEDFSSQNASGSTSQAANIMEALEMDTTLLLIDEDTSATNFMIRDARMQQLVRKDKEPITPFIDRVQDLYTEKGISSILVIGGSGDYFDVADVIYMMEEYQPFNKTREAKKIAQDLLTQRTAEISKPFQTLKQKRMIDKRRLFQLFDKKEKVESKGLHNIKIGKTIVDLTYLEQLVHQSQTQALALMIKRIIKHSKEPLALKEAINDLYEKLEHQGIDSLSPFAGQHPGDFALPRKLELAAAINRIRH